jgi:hypothetical protein
MAGSIEEWASKVLNDYRQETGWPFASTWQSANGALPPGKRLMPKIPFFLGGDYHLDNLWVGEAVTGMRSKGDLALQTRDLPSGSQIRLVVGKNL